MIDIITGSNDLGSFLNNADENVTSIVAVLDAINSEEALPQLKGMDFLKPFITQIEGVEGHTEGERDYQVFASDDGSYSDANTYKESYTKWRFTRRGYVVKDKDFTKEMVREADELNKDLSVIVNTRMKAISDMYLNRFIPNISYEPLFIVPEEGGEYTSKPEGFLRNVKVNPMKLKLGSQQEEYLVRNHYRAIKNPTTGVEADDIEDILEFLSEYRDITDTNIIGIGSRRSLYKLRSCLKWEGNMDVFNRTGLPAYPICGVLFIVNDFMPKDWLLFLDGQADKLITQLVSPKVKYRGIAIEKEKGFEKVETIQDMMGSFFRIQPTGYHLTGRHKGCFLYIGEEIGTATADPNKNRTTKLCSQEELNLLSAHAFELKQSWYKGIR